MKNALFFNMTFIPAHKKRMAPSAAERNQVEKASVVLPQIPAQNLRKK